MLGGVTRHMLPHLPGVPHLHVNRPLDKKNFLQNIQTNTQTIILAKWRKCD